MSLTVGGCDYCTSQLVAATNQTATTLIFAAPTEPWPTFDADHTYFYLTIVDEPSYIADAVPPTQREIFKVTSAPVQTANGWELTGVRGSAGTTAQIWAVGAVAEIRPCYQWLEDLKGTMVQASYVVMDFDPDLDFERKLTAGTGIIITDNGPNDTVVISTTGVSGGVFSGSILYTIPGTYSWIPPNGVSVVTITGCGNGGAGGGGAVVNAPKGGGGGGSGEGVTGQTLAVTAGVPVVTVIPVAAAAVVGGDGNDGGNVTVDTTGIVLLGGKGGKSSGVGGAGGGTGGGAGGNFGDPIGSSGSVGTAETTTYYGGAGGGGGGSGTTANGGPGADAGTFFGGLGGSADGGSAGGGGGGATLYGPGARGADGNGSGTPGSGNAHIRIVQRNESSGYTWDNGSGGVGSPVITSWTYPGMTTSIRILVRASTTVNTYDPTTLNFVAATTAQTIADSYTNSIDLASGSSDGLWVGVGYHIKTDGTRIPLFLNRTYVVGSGTNNIGLAAYGVTGTNPNFFATVNFGSTVGLPAGEYVGNVISSTNYKTLYIFTSSSSSGNNTKWYKVVDSAVVSQGTVSPSISVGEIGDGRANMGFGGSGFRAACFEDDAPYCWSYDGGGSHIVYLYSINSAGNYALDTVGGIISEVAPGGNNRGSMISPGLGYGAVVGNTTLAVLTRWADGSEGGVFGIGGGGGGGGADTGGGDGGTGRILLEWTGFF